MNERRNLMLLGCGSVSLAILSHLLLRWQRPPQHLTLIDRSAESLDRARDVLARLDVRGTQLDYVRTDAADHAALQALAAGRDALICGGDWSCLKQLSAVAPSGALLIGIGRPDYAEVAGIDASLRSRGVSVINAAGLEPGLAEIIGAQAVAALERPRALHLRCGGIPVEPKGPFPYKRLFGGKYLPFELRPTFTYEQGALVGVERFSGVESLFVEGVGTLEAWHDGLLPWLVEREPFCRLQTLTQKTLRWPGYAQTVQTLHALELLSHVPVEGDGGGITPWELVNAVLRPLTQFGDADSDLVVLTATALGAGPAGASEERCSIELLDRRDPVSGLTAMARTTGFACSLMLEAVLSGDRILPGYFSPESIFRGARAEALFAGLRAAGIVVRVNQEAARAPRHNAGEALGFHA